MLYMPCVCQDYASVHCCLVVTCWERADLLALVCDLVYKFKRIGGKPNFSVQFKKISKQYKKGDTTWISCDSLHAWL